jgi:hypothetical protein
VKKPPRIHDLRAHYRRRIARTKNPVELVVQLSAILEDPIIQGERSMIGPRRDALAALLELRGLDAEMLL